MTNDNRSFILAILLSIVVLIGWNAFIAAPRIEDEQERLKRQQQAESTVRTPGASTTQPQTGSNSAPTPEVTPLPSAGQTGVLPIPGSAAVRSRASLIKATKRILIRTDALEGSINLSGGRIDV